MVRDRIRRYTGSVRAWVRSDDVRSILATVILGITTLVFVLLSMQEGEARLTTGLMVLNLGWTTFAIIMVALTHWAYSSLDHDALRPAVRHRPTRWVQRLTGLSETTSWVVPVAWMALVVAFIALMLPQRSLLTQFSALVCALSCWVLVATMQALAYARLHLVGHSSGDERRAGEGGLVFEQAEPTRFPDYLYLAYSLQAALSHPGVGVRSHMARREVTRHLVVAFVFNTIIIAVLVALLLGIVRA